MNGRRVRNLFLFQGTPGDTEFIYRNLSSGRLSANAHGRQEDEEKVEVEVEEDKKKMEKVKTKKKKIFLFLFSLLSLFVFYSSLLNNSLALFKLILRKI